MAPIRRALLIALALPAVLAFPSPGSAAGREQVTLAKVSTPTPARKRRLIRLGVEATESGGPRYLVIVLHRGDRAKLRRAGFRFRVLRRPAPRATAAALPSGRTSYRTLADYNSELDSLAAANPDLVKPFTLAHQTRLGRPLRGIEITTDPNARDGKPVFLMLGLHHANEWPSGEHTIEFARDLIQTYRDGDPRTTLLLNETRAIFVPVVNPDGFNFSRSAETGTAAEQQRKNCPSTGCVAGAGVDVNRNYGAWWGGIGSDSSPGGGFYRGSAPFSEPESQDIRELISSHQVVAMITNHTEGNLILRQPGWSALGPSPDEAAYKALGAKMAAENGYSNQFSWQLYEHVGTADMWSYYSTGGLGYVFEIGSGASHPAFSSVISAYDGSSVAGGGNREAYFHALEATADPALHSVLTGNAPPGAVLRVAKDFSTLTTGAGSIPDHLESTMVVPASGHFEWNLNPSGRPQASTETWTLTCEIPEGTVLFASQVAVARGQTVPVSPCTAHARPDPNLVVPNAREKPGIHLNVRASFNGRDYRIRVAGSLDNVADKAKLNPGDAGPGSERCAGKVAITLRAKRKKIISRKTTVDAGCAYERSFKFGRRKLPRSLRKKGARIRIQALTHWAGNSFLRPADRRVTVRVKRR
jgi:carboxypeptidase T